MKLFFLGAFLLCLLSTSPTTTAADHNITTILADFPDLSTFNHYLTLTHLAPEINSRQTITILAPDNTAMNHLLNKNLPTSTLKNVLSLHILLDYFGAKKLHQITDTTSLAATLYQTTGTADETADGTTGFVNVTDLKGGKVSFAALKGTDATFVKSIKEIPYNISIIQISHVLSNSEAEAPASAPVVQDITDVMSAHGCKAFSDTLKTFPDALTVYTNNLEGGLTVFCPTDNAFNNFVPKFKNLTKDDKISLLLFHGVPIYYSMSMLKSGNGVFNTLATDGKMKFDFTVQNDGKDVTLKTKIVTATITSTILDKDPVAVFALDTVLKPEEIFKSEISPAPAPAPENAPGKKKHKEVASPPKPSDESGSPAVSPVGNDTAAADEDKNGGGERKRGVWMVGVSVGFWMIINMFL